MPQFETEDVAAVARCRRSQFSFQPIPLPLVDTFGVVHSIVMVADSRPTRWLVTFTPQPLPRNVATKTLNPGPRYHRG